MGKFMAFLVGIAGILVLAGYFVVVLQPYYLVPIGGVLAIIASLFVKGSGKFLAGLGGIFALAGEYLAILQPYYIVPIGGVLVLVGAVIGARAT